VTSASNYNSYFWNVGVKYNKNIPKYQSSRCRGGSGGAAGGSAAGGICCLICCGAGIWFFFIKGNEDKPSDPEPSVEEEAPQQEMTQTVVQ
jgi:hypothetical protein